MTIYSLDIPFAQFGTSLCSMSSSNYCFLTHIQVSQEASKVVWYAHLFENFPQFIVINIVKDFSEVNEAEVDVLLDLLCFLHDPVNVGNLISGFSASSKPSLYIWKFLFQVSPKKDIDFCFVLSLFFFFFYWLKGQVWELPVCLCIRAW